MRYVKTSVPTEVYVLRVESGEDLLETTEAFVRDRGIGYAAIVSAIGSATSYRYHVVTSPELPPQEAFPSGKRPVDISHIQGYVLQGRVHAHITFSDQQVSFGGHLEKGVRVLTFAVLTFLVLPSDLDIAAWDRL